jgi:hypothetical protein
MLRKLSHVVNRNVNQVCSGAADGELSAFALSLRSCTQQQPGSSGSVKIDRSKWTMIDISSVAPACRRCHSSKYKQGHHTFCRMLVDKAVAGTGVSGGGVSSSVRLELYQLAQQYAMDALVVSTNAGNGIQAEETPTAVQVNPTIYATAQEAVKRLHFSAEQATTPATSSLPVATATSVTTSTRPWACFASTV